MPGIKKSTGATGLRASGKTVVQIWLDEETLAKLDAARQTRYGTLPRTTVVITALKEFLDHTENS